jgi:hypothetical protein
MCVGAPKSAENNDAMMAPHSSLTPRQLSGLRPRGSVARVVARQKADAASSAPSMPSDSDDDDGLEEDMLVGPELGCLFDFVG